MASYPTLVYLDANVILNYLIGTEGKSEILADVLSRSERPGFVTSTVTVTEVAYFLESARRPDAIGDAGLSAISQFWAERHVTLFDPTQVAAELGRDFIRELVAADRINKQSQIRKRSVDAHHVGCAIYCDAQELWTYDEKFSALAPYWKKVIIREPWIDKPRLFTDP